MATLIADHLEPTITARRTVGGLYPSPFPKQHREYLYIDGGCLRETIKSVCKTLFLNPEAYRPLISAFAQSGAYDKIYYYDAIPAKGRDESQAAYEVRINPFYEKFEKIQALDRVHTELGEITGKDRRQKGVDVRLAVDMMTHTFRQNISRATLLAGDADFIPLVRALVSEGLDVTLLHPMQANAKLKGAADSIRPLDIKQCLKYMTLDDTRPAFELYNVEPTTPISMMNLDVVEIDYGTVRYAISFISGNLRVFCMRPSHNLTMATVVAPNVPFEHALSVLCEISGWNIIEEKNQIMNALKIRPTF